MTPEALTALIDATWPAASRREVQGWTIREGRGAGSRVSAATATATARLEDIPKAEAEMSALNQPSLFMIRQGEAALDAHLEAAGYAVKDPVTAYLAPVEDIATRRPPPVTCFEVWPPLAVQGEIWDAGGVDAARLAVMARASGPKTTVLGRIHDTPVGTAFAAIHEGTAMIHAIETSHAFRRQGVGRNMVRALAFWAKGLGAQDLALLVTTANLAANTLYASMGFAPVGGYHYRILPKART